MPIKKFLLLLILSTSLFGQMGGDSVSKNDKLTDISRSSENNHINSPNLAVQEELSTFPRNTTWQDYPVDDDRNGLYNRLVVDIGYYNPQERIGVYGILFDEEENILGISNFVNDNEETYVSLSFPGQPIHASGTDGPYFLRAGLYTPGWWGYIDISEINFSLMYKTQFQSYNHSQFERPRAMITGFSDYGNDTDDDTFYDEIVIGIQTEVTDYGYYEIAAYFEHSIDKHDTQYEISSHWSGYLQPGHNFLEIQLSASEFYKTKKSGYIRMNYVHLSLYGEPQHILTEAYNTSSVFYEDLASPSMELTGNYWDNGLDTDSNELYNQLEIIIEVNCTRAGYYTIILDLAPNSSQDSFLSYNQDLYKYWSVGIANISIIFDATPFYNMFSTTPFVTQDLTILDDQWEIQQLVPRPYTTREYSYTEFDYPQIFATGNYWDEGHDSNSNGLFDQLIITIEVNVTHTGSFGYSLELQPTTGTDQCWTQYFYEMSTFVTIGVQNVTIAIDTDRYYSIRRNTSFRIEYLEFTMDFGVNIRIELPYTTQEYQYTEFEKPAVYFTGRFWDFGVEGASEDIYELLALTCEVNSSQIGDYMFYIRLKALNSSIAWDQDQDINMALGKNINNVTFYFDMSRFYATDNHTDFFIETFEIRDNNWDTVDRAFSPYTTRSYQNSKFQPPAVYLTGNYYDYGEDLDGNGKIDDLILEVEINVTQPGVYSFDVGLEPLIPVWDSNRWVNFHQTLNLGIQNITLQMYVTLPYSLRLDTAFVIYHLTISDTEDWEEVFRQPSPLITRVYKYNEFDPPGIILTGNIWEIEEDTDSDDHLDLILYEIEVNVTQPSYYSYEYQLYSTDWYYNEGDYFGQQFDEGLANITITISTKLLYTYFDDLTITLGHFSLLNYNDNIVDRLTREYTTRVYSYGEFDPPGAYLKSNYYDQGVDIDQDGKYEILTIWVRVAVLQYGYYTLNLNMYAAPAWTYFRETVAGSWEEGEYFIDVNISASRLPLNFAGSEQMYVDVSYVAILEGSASGELISYQYGAFITNTYRVDQFDQIIDTSSVPPVFPGLNGQNVLFGVTLLIFISSFLLIRRKRFI
ncbi:hypothetical protein CEE45_10930 [Candidatus Heimdallarchaeota archaeon B3_Heim]|nr:MAG: hypothetical protein CEE45_10930 [Candidatus Heimdallarchaeota archaeon B3_Heim]